MNRYSTLILGIAALALGPSIASARPQANSFLDAPAPNHAALIRQVRTDGDVMDRYQRHFAMTRSQVLAYFTDLRLTRLQHDQAYDVYAVPRGGALKSTRRTLRRGTLVWVDRRGKAILMEVCGNPLTRGPEKPEADNILVAELTSPPLEALKPMLAGPVPNEDLSDEMFAVTEASEPGPFPAPSETVTSAPAPEPASAGPAQTPSAPTVTRPAIPLLGAGTTIPAILNVLSGGAAVGIGVGLIDGGLPSETPREPARPSDPVDVVPEPASLLALGAGIASVVASRRRRRAGK